MSGRILGAIVAGGQSRRFGSDKAVAVWRGGTLVDHARIALAAVTDEVIVCGRSAVASPTGQRAGAALLAD